MFLQKVLEGLFRQILKIELSVARQEDKRLPGFLVDLHPFSWHALPLMHDGAQIHAADLISG
ncbi:MAG: hypothetical protein JO188_04915 [Hyphomicrobiales bacterium]|nr:hypothetical protein [Hyphomicrobiales bacterium]